MKPEQLPVLVFKKFMTINFLGYPTTVCFNPHVQDSTVQSYVYTYMLNRGYLDHIIWDGYKPIHLRVNCDEFDIELTARVVHAKLNSPAIVIGSKDLEKLNIQVENPDDEILDSDDDEDD